MAAPDTSPSALALYVHIPFCETKCPYCDFNTYAGIEALMPTYVDTLAHDIAEWGKWLGRPPLRSVFFGGGTPSYLPTRSLRLLMRAITEAFDLPEGAEVTAEANPGDTARERLQAMRRAGFNRISIGVQSLDDDELRLLGRRHNAEAAQAAVRTARAAGFERINADLIFGLPGQMVASWEHTLAETLALEPDHLSAYALTLEPGTPLDADVRQGRVREPDPDIAAEMYRLTGEMLAGAGYEQYEISNWAKPAQHSAHNLAYWRSEPYLGVGPGAHSYLWSNGIPALEDAGLWGTRFAAVRSPRQYIDAAREWRAPAEPASHDVIQRQPTIGEAEALSRSEAMADYVMMGLRLNEGLSEQAFGARFGELLEEALAGALRECGELGLVERTEGYVRLTDAGRPLANEAFERFVSACSAIAG